MKHNFRILTTGIIIFLSIRFDSDAILLSGVDNKSWTLIPKTSPDSECKFSKSTISDNSYTFHRSGKYEFDNGLIHTDIHCENCCSDMFSVEGVWEFTRGGKGLRVIILHEKNNKSNAHEFVLFDGNIERLDEGVLILSQKDPETKTRYTLEFHKKN